MARPRQQPADACAASEGQVCPADVRAHIPPTIRRPPAKVALGKRLFEDKELSSTGTIACASCHDPKLSFTDGEPTGKGVTGSRSCGTRRRSGTSPGARCCSGTAGPRASRSRCAFPSSTPTRWAPRSITPSHASRGTRATCAPSPQAFPARPAISRRQHRQGARRLRAHAGLPADPLRPLGRRRRRRPHRRRRSTASNLRRQGPLHQLPHRLRLHRPRLLRHRPAQRGRGPRQRSACPPPTTPSRRRRCASSPGPRPTCTTARSARSTTWCASTRWAACSGPRAARTCRGSSSSPSRSATTSSPSCTLSSETPPQPSTEAVGRHRGQPAPPPPPQGHHRRQPGQQAVRPGACSPRRRADAHGPQRRHAHPQRAHLRPPARLQLRRAGAQRERHHPLSRPRHLRGLLRHPSVHAADGGGAIGPSRRFEQCQQRGLVARAPPPAGRAAARGAAAPCAPAWHVCGSPMRLASQAIIAADAT